VGLVDGIGGDYYATLGIRPALGRFITREDIGLEHSLVAVIAYRDWQERYHSDPGVIGKTILIDGEPYTIIGVRPKSFPGLIRENAADATVPLTLKTSGIAAPLSDGSGMASIPRRHGRGWRRSGR